MFDMHCGDIAHRGLLLLGEDIGFKLFLIMIILNTEATEICKQCNCTRRYTLSTCTKNDTPCKGVSSPS